MRRTFKDDELSFPQRFCDRSRCAFDVTQIRIATLIERRRHADDDAVRFSQASEIGSRFELVVANELRKRGRIDVLDVALPSVELVHLGLVDVEPHTTEAGRSEGANKRQTDIPEA